MEEEGTFAGYFLMMTVDGFMRFPPMLLCTSEQYILT